MKEQEGAFRLFNTERWSALSLSLSYDILVNPGAIGLPMPRWIVSCPECDHESTYREVEVSSDQLRDPFAWPPKPKMAEGGTPFKCSNCGKKSTCDRSRLRYRRDCVRSV